METEQPFLSRKDHFILWSLTAVYAITALVNLGSFKAPQSYWKPAQKGESFYVDLGQSQNIDRVSYFLSLGEGSYKLDFSDDLRAWRDEHVAAQKTVYEMIEWRYFRLGHDARYVRITCEKPGAMLNEIGFFGPGNKTAIPIRSVVKTGLAETAEHGRPENVFDEQNTIAYTPSFMNGMYFDEIYHARTAYEYLHHIHPTEPTHPPLGKVLISLGIAIFGMTPFGWRIMGTLFGIAMIPAVYCFAKRLFKRTEYAFIAGFLLAFDFMHFYTRIAVIDGFAVFFIIMMYYFMYRYFMMDFLKVGVGRTVVPLLLSGIFFGLGAATKWIAVFGGAGLVVILFAALGERFLEYVRARKVIHAKNARRGGVNYKEKAAIVGSFWPGLAKTLLWCVAAFIVVPCIIYVLAYVPFMMTPGPGHGLGDVVRLQKYIYDYHSGMQITHPFSSSWWEWPIIRKPLWLYMGKDIAAGYVSSIVAMGNPAIWWPGVPAMIAAAFLAAYRKDKAMLAVLAGAASQYLPWATGPTKLTFIFHFFATTPFMILCIAYVLMSLSDRYKNFRYAVYAYLALVLLLFAAFYPILTGTVVSKAYVTTYLRWFNSWIFCV